MYLSANAFSFCRAELQAIYTSFDKTINAANWKSHWSSFQRSISCTESVSLYCTDGKAFDKTINAANWKSHWSSFQRSISCTDAKAFDKTFAPPHSFSFISSNIGTLILAHILHTVARDADLERPVHGDEWSYDVEQGFACRLRVHQEQCRCLCARCVPK